MRYTNKSRPEGTQGNATSAPSAPDYCVFPTLPGVETPGYGHPPLCGEEGDGGGDFQPPGLAAGILAAGFQPAVSKGPDSGARKKQT